MIEKSTFERPSVLIVDDAPDNLTLLKHLLSQEGYEVRVAPGGRLALQSVRASPPDLILLDVRMPDMSGFAVCRELKRVDATRDIPVIFLTALDSIEDEGRGLELGAVDYITKPFSPHVAKARVRNHLRFVHQRKLLERWALLDGLTEIPNRRRFDEALQREVKRARRTLRPLSLALLDLDDFKGYNDAHGHPAGDRALCAVAHALVECCNRSGDLVARYGGEEFVLLMAETEAGGAAGIAERARAAVEGLGLSYPTHSGDTLVTVSAGGVTCRPSGDLTAEQVLEHADRCLYRAKAAGRNRVEWQNLGGGA